MTIVPIRIFTSKIYRKGIKGNLTTVYHRILVWIVRTFPHLVSALFGFDFLDSAGIESFFSNIEVSRHTESFTIFHFDDEEREKIINVVPISLREKTLDAAEELMSYRFIFKGVSHRFSDEIDWFIEPKGNKGWRWDLNRHFFLLTLARAYLYSRDPKYVNRIEQIIANWCMQNPCSLNNPNWNEPFEVAARLNNWIWLYHLLKDLEDTPHLLPKTLLEGIYKHGSYLFRLLEIHIPNNHLLLEAKALYEASLVLPQIPAVKKWRYKSFGHLQRQFMRQVKRDGGHSEQAITYHRIINSEILEIYALALKKKDTSIISQFRAPLMAMSEFLHSMMQSNGSFPLIGDSTSFDTYYRFNPFMIAATVFERPDDKYAAILMGEDDLTFFLLGLEGAEKYKRLPLHATAKCSACFLDSGYYVMRDESMGLQAVIDCGPFCDERIPAHGHDDILSFNMSLQDSPLIVDSGNDGLPLDAPEATLWRAYFRGAKSHNVIIVDGRNRSHLIGYRDILRVAKPLQCEWYTDDMIAYFLGGHDGYQRPLGVIHQREIVLIKGYFLCVIDRLLGDGNQQVDLLYHLAPDKRALTNAQGIVEVLGEKGHFASITIFGLEGSTRVVRGSAEPIQGWVSFESGCRIETDTVWFHTNAKLPVWVGTLIKSHNDEVFKVESKPDTSNSLDYLQTRFIVSAPNMTYEFLSSTKPANHDLGYFNFQGRFVLAKLLKSNNFEILFKKA